MKRGRQAGLVPTIVGGQEADPGEYPWMVALLLPDSCCGGAVINSRLVVIYKKPVVLTIM